MLVLASRSPRRAELLTRAGFAFTVAPADVDEAPRPGEDPHALVARLAHAKASAVAAKRPSAVVVGADTLVVVEATTLGKPTDATDATAMLHRLSGRTHEVLTGVAVHAGKQRLCDVASSRVTMRSLSEDDIGWYVGSEEPMGKAGAYAIQGLASRFVVGIDGSYTNIVGLPIELLDRLLRAVGVDRGIGVYENSSRASR